MLTIIEVAAREDGGHGLQSQSHRTECWLEGWVAVPPELEQTVWDCRGYCQLELQDGVLTVSQDIALAKGVELEVTEYYTYLHPDPSTLPEPQ